MLVSYIREWRHGYMSFVMSTEFSNRIHLHSENLLRLMCYILLKYPPTSVKPKRGIRAVFEIEIDSMSGLSVRNTFSYSVVQHRRRHWVAGGLRQCCRSSVRCSWGARGGGAWARARGGARARRRWRTTWGATWAARAAAGAPARTPTCAPRSRGSTAPAGSALPTNTIVIYFAYVM